MKINMATRTFAIGLTLACGLLLGGSLVNAASCTEPTLTPDGSTTPGFTGVQFGELYCGTDPKPFSDSYINGSPSLVKFNFEEGSSTGFDEGEEGVASSFGDPGQFSYIDNVIFSDLDYNDEDEIIGGTWTWTSDDGELFPTILLLKSGENFVIYSVVGLLTGMFSTEDLDGKGLSHISFYDGANSTTPEVPLPAGILLLISALGGLGFLSRFRKAGAKA